MAKLDKETVRESDPRPVRGRWRGVPGSGP